LEGGLAQEVFLPATSGGLISFQLAVASAAIEPVKFEVLRETGLPDKAL
jgi:hypothetical protein